MFKFLPFLQFYNKLVVLILVISIILHQFTMAFLYQREIINRSKMAALAIGCPLFNINHHILA